MTSQQDGPPPDNQAKLAQYVLGALQKNPLEQSESIVRSRNRLLGLTKVTAKLNSQSAIDPRQHRQAILKKLETIRAEFWTKPLAELKSTIHNIDAEQFPDVQSAARRLSIVAASRDKIPALISHKAFDGEFFKVFRDVLTLAPRDSAVAKERMLAQFSNSKVRERGTKMIRVIQQQLPELYDLETTWLNSLIKQKSRRLLLDSRDKSQSSVVSSRAFHFPWWLIPVVLAILRAIIRAADQ